MKMFKLPKPNMRWFVYAAWMFVGIGILSWYFFSGGDENPFSGFSKTSFGEIQKQIETNPQSIKTLTFYKEPRIDTPVKVTVDGEKRFWATVPGTHDYNLLSDAAEKQHVAKDARELVVDKKNPWLAALGMVISYGLPIALFAGLWFMMSRGGAMNAAQKHSKIALTRLDQSDKPVKFADVAGIDDELKKIQRLVLNIRHPELLTKLGGKLPVGLQLVGPPGTGKTFLVQAISGESGIPVLSCSGSDFVEMYVGVGAARMRDAWRQARELRDQMNSWVILFCDEFDSVGRSRAEGGGNDERNQTVGQILVELQGTQADNSRILFVIATNQPDSIDPAIVRSGRLGDQKVEVVAPDKEGRIAILKVKLKKIPAGEDVQVEDIADEMSGMTGADIDTLVTKRAPEFAETRLLERVPVEKIWQPGGLNLDEYFKEEEFKVLHQDIWKALEEMSMGAISETKGRRLHPQVREMIAYHELGHFTVAMRKRLQSTGDWDGQYGDMIKAISILGPNGVGGFVKTVPEHDFRTAKNLKGFLAIALAGNRAERMFLGDATGGCSNDLQQANRIVKAMLLSLNMSDFNNEGWKLPPVSVDFRGASRYLGGQSTHAENYGMSDDSARQVDKFISLFLLEAEAEADAYLKEEQDWVRFMAPKLIKAERMRFDAIEKLWNEFHGDKDLSRAVAFPYAWDKNHEGLSLVRPEPYKGPDDED